MPEEGGGGRGVRHLACRRRGDLDAVEVDLEAIGNDLRDLGIKALAHFRAAMVQVDRAILIDMDERAGLVEGGHGEGDAEFHRGQRNALADHAALPVEGDDLLAALPIRGLFGKLGDEARHDIVFHRLVVGRQYAIRAGLAVEIGHAHIERVLAQRIGDFFHETFGTDAALWAAEAAEGGVETVLVFSGRDFTSTCG